VAHAIGAGCLILEVQEPTDFTIQPEAWCGDYRLDPFEMFLGLDEQVALECFDFEHLVGERAVAAGRKSPRCFLQTAAVEGERLLTYDDTRDFAVNRYRLHAGSHPLASGPAVYVVTGGKGRIETEGFACPVGRGDYFFLPASAKEPRLAGEPDHGAASALGALEVVECLPPRFSPG
jgi:mannose-6-phosphate isomerase